MSLLTAKKADLDMARRLIGHNRLVLIADNGAHEIAKRTQEEESPGLVCVERFDDGDAITNLARLRTVLARETHGTRQPSKVVLNAAGGDGSLVLAMLLLAYEGGHETWFVQEGRHERLPVLVGVAIQNRLDRHEEAVLRCIGEEGATSSELAQLAILGRPHVEAALRRLQKKDLVKVYAEDGRVAARLSATGLYLKDHL